MICVPIRARNTPEALDKMTRAARLADLVELRLDLMETFDLETLLGQAPCPVIVTYRSVKEGGRGRATYREQVRILTRAAAAGARWIDVEFGMPREFKRVIRKNRRDAGLLVSCHLQHGTPDRKSLEELLWRMDTMNADMVKIVTLARSYEDNLRVLGLIPLARKLGIGVVAFCMGPKGRPSRVLAPLLGAAFTFASLKAGEETAAGQLFLEETRWILNRLGGA